jgi:hypothetical protein
MSISDEAVKTSEASEDVFLPDAVLNLAIDLARLADAHPRQQAIDALDIAAVLLRFGRSYDLSAMGAIGVDSQSSSVR